MNPDDEPTFWEKLTAFVLAVAAVCLSVIAARHLIVGLMGMCQ
jgi:hypothetical protein